MFFRAKPFFFVCGEPLVLLKSSETGRISKREHPVLL